jgi:hypothetical protein
MIRTIFTLAITLAATTAVLAWQTPVDGSADRKALLDAIRPQAEEALGAPVEFIVEQARISGSPAFVVVSPQRPGGGKIDLDATPLALREDGYFPHFHDGGRIDALLEKSGETWVVKKFVIGVMADWWSDPSYCDVYAPVLPEVCG